MAILCLAKSLTDLKERLGRIIIGYTPRRKAGLPPRDLKAHGAMAALLKDAIKPNLVQTLENNPAFIHGGPFANIAHGCNSVIATKAALKLADYVVTEAGFGADLGAEKFIDIKCRKAGPQARRRGAGGHRPRAEVPRRRAKEDLNQENLAALEKGIVNLERHLQEHAGALRPALRGVDQPLHLRHRGRDRAAQSRIEALGGRFVLARHWAEGGKGAEEVARAVVEMAETGARHKYVYEDTDSLLAKITAIATKIYGAGRVTFADSVRKQTRRVETRTTATSRCAWPRRRCRSRPTPTCAARRAATRSTCAKCGWPTARVSSSRCAAT